MKWSWRRWTRWRLVCLTACCLFNLCCVRGEEGGAEHSAVAGLGDAECTEKLRPVLRKVAMLFLVRGYMLHEPIWQRWFSGIANVSLAELHCNSELKACYDKLHAGREKTSIVDYQDFYNIYVHHSPDFRGYASSSIFHGRVIKELIRTGWGSYTLVEAERILIKTALEDPFNQRFMIICEHSVPLRPPFFVYTQLMEGTKSRGLFPTPWPKNRPLEPLDKRIPLEMAGQWREILEYFAPQTQWMMLTRAHAEMVRDDAFVHIMYEKHCHGSAEKHHFFESARLEGSKEWCISDEQYFATLLSSRGVPRADITHWPALDELEEGDGIPAERISLEWFQDLRNNRGCEPWKRHAMWRTVDTQDPEACTAPGFLLGDSYAKEAKPSGAKPYNGCRLFVRKFRHETHSSIAGVIGEFAMEARGTADA